MNIRSTILAMAVAALFAGISPAQDYELFFAQDEAAGALTGEFYWQRCLVRPNGPRPDSLGGGHYPDYTKSKEEFNRFQNACGGVSAVNFDHLMEPGNGFDQTKRVNNWIETQIKKEVVLHFGDQHTATMTGMSRIIKVKPGESAAGGFPTSGDTFVSLYNKTTSSSATIRFDEPQVAFGFYVTDIEVDILQFTLVRETGEQNITFDQMKVYKPTGASVISEQEKYNAGICFVGVIAKVPFDAVRLSNPGTSGEGYGFDDMLIAKSKDLEIPVTEPDPKKMIEAMKGKGSSDYALGCAMKKEGGGTIHFKEFNRPAEDEELYLDAGKKVNKFCMAEHGRISSNCAYWNLSDTAVTVNNIVYPTTGYVVHTSHDQHIAQPVKIRYTAPEAGSYKFTVTWELLNKKPNSVGIAISTKKPNEDPVYVFGIHPDDHTKKNDQKEILDASRPSHIETITLTLKQDEEVFVEVDRNTLGYVGEHTKATANNNDETLVKIQNKKLN